MFSATVAERTRVGAAGGYLAAGLLAVNGLVQWVLTLLLIPIGRFPVLVWLVAVGYALR